jgi:hypothetical protein
MRQITNGGPTFTATFADGSQIVENENGIFGDVQAKGVPSVFAVQYGEHLASVNLTTGVIDVDGVTYQRRQVIGGAVGTELIYKKDMVGTPDANDPNLHVALTLGYRDAAGETFGVRVYPGSTHTPDALIGIDGFGEPSIIPDHAYVEREPIAPAPAE